MAMAATPSPRPVRPRPSVVVAETVTGAPTALLSTASRLGPAGAEPRAVADHLDGDVADLEARGADPSAVSVSRRSGGTGPGGSDVPKLLPRSPSPAADSSASQAACAATSASE